MTGPTVFIRLPEGNNTRTIRELRSGLTIKVLIRRWLHSSRRQATKAKAKGVELNTLVNDLLKKDIALIEGIK